MTGLTLSYKKIILLLLIFCMHILSVSYLWWGFCKNEIFAFYPFHVFSSGEASEVVMGRLKKWFANYKNV